MRDQHAEIGERRRVYLLARKTLMRNTRIFKQARTLTDAGFDVVVIGIKRPDAPEREVRDGYTLVRLPIVPLHARLPRAMRRRGRALAAVGPAVGRANRATSGVLARALNRIAFPLRSLEYYRQVHRLVTTRLPPPAVVHANDLDTLLIGALLARRFRAPLIYDAQELYTGLHTLPGWYRRLLTVQEAVLLRATDRVIAVNPPIAAEMERRYRHRVDTVVLNCPPYEELAGNGSGPTIRDLFRIPADAPVFLFSGGLSRSRGLENAILALREAPHAVLVILGEGALKDELVALAEREGLSERVLFCDFVPHEQVPRLISSVDVGLIPYENVGINHYLSSPSKLFHYVMAEVPIACSDFPFLRSIVVANDVGAVFDPADPASIARALEAIVADPVRYRRHKANLARIKRRYCWEEEAERFLSVYRSVAP